MSYSVETHISLDEKKIIQRVTCDSLGIFIAEEWKKLISPYTPHDTGRLEESAVISPWQIKYAPKNSSNGFIYAAKVYYGNDMNFRKTYNPFATSEWDGAAEQSGKKGELYRAINEKLHSR